MRARVNGIEIAYDRAGSGEPVLLVMGWATTRLGWVNQMPVLAERYDVACFDNRGIGESEAPYEPWTMDTMVADTVGVMDLLGFERVHLAGISMGGMISQEVALRYPERVRSLTLISTQHGGPEHVPPSEAALAAFSSLEGDPAARVEKLIRITFGRRFQEERPDYVEAAINFAVARPAPLHSVVHQLSAVMQWSLAGGSADRLGRIAAPALVLHGTADELIPSGNGELIAAKIPGARLRLFPDAGHALIAERADEVNEELLAHFSHS